MGRCNCDVLQQELAQSIGKLLNKSAYTFQQDLAPWRTAELVQEKMAKLKLNVLEWPAKNPDLNPIEMLCSILDKKLAAKAIYSIMAFRQPLEEEWNGIRKLSCLNSIVSMPDRIQKCLKSKGGYFMWNCISLY